MNYSLRARRKIRLPALLGIILLVLSGFSGPGAASFILPLAGFQVHIDPAAAAAAKQATIACTGDCRCLKESDAAAVLGSSYQKCAAVPCEYDSAGTPKFCFHTMAGTTTTAVVQPSLVKYAASMVPTTTPVMPVQAALVSQVPAAVAASCPADCRLMTEQAAREQYGEFARCTESPRGYDSNGSPNYCIRPNTTTSIISDRLQSSLISSAGQAILSGNASANISSENLAVIRKFWTTRDALAALRIAVGGDPYSADFDLTGDGRVDSSDAREILKRSVAGNYRA